MNIADSVRYKYSHGTHSPSHRAPWSCSRLGERRLDLGGDLDCWMMLVSHLALTNVMGVGGTQHWTLFRACDIVGQPTRHTAGAWSTSVTKGHLEMVNGEGRVE